MSEWWENPDLINALTAVVREADQQHLRDGGSTRHWVRDCFLPLLAESGVLTDPALRLAILDAMGLDVRERWEEYRGISLRVFVCSVRPRGEATDA